MSETTGRVPEPVIQRAAGIRLAVFDVDGVLTDGRIGLGDDGFESKTFHSHDGLGLRLLQDSGVAVALITGRTSTVVRRRAEELRIRFVMQGRPDKGDALAELCSQQGLEASASAYIGDDVVDLPAMRAAGLGIAVGSATPMTRAYADYVTLAAGGAGAAREVAELLMAAQGTLQAACARFVGAG